MVCLVCNFSHLVYIFVLKPDIDILSNAAIVTTMLRFVSYQRRFEKLCVKRKKERSFGNVFFILILTVLASFLVNILLLVDTLEVKEVKSLGGDIYKMLKLGHVYFLLGGAFSEAFKFRALLSVVMINLICFCLFKIAERARVLRKSKYINQEFTLLYKKVKNSNKNFCQK